MITQILMIVAPLVSANAPKQPWASGRAQFRAAAKAKIPDRFLSSELTPDKVQEFILIQDKLKNETGRWPRAHKFELLKDIREKRRELERLEQQLLQCERAIATETIISVQHEGETLQVCQPHVQAVAPVGPLGQLLNQILDFCWSAKLEFSGTSRYQTDKALCEEMDRFYLESSKLRYYLDRENGEHVHFLFSAAQNHITDRLAKIHYIQKILDEHALQNQCAQAIQKYVNGGSGSVSFSVQESKWDWWVHEAMGDYKGPVFEHKYLDRLSHSVFVYRQRISEKLRDLPRVLAA